MSYGCSASGDASGFRGCGREFGALRDFDRHWTKVTIEDDESRDRATVNIGGTRCATDIELEERGMVLRGKVWKDAEAVSRWDTYKALSALSGSSRSDRGASSVGVAGEGKRA